MRILAVAQRLSALEREIQVLRKRAAGAVGRKRRQIIADRSVVSCRMREGFLCELEASGCPDGAVGGTHFF